eukprot:1337329-Pleurochrysis_carterae.AAC.4
MGRIARLAYGTPLRRTFANLGVVCARWIGAKCSANNYVSLDRSALFAISWMVFGDGGPKTHWSKKTRLTPVIDASCIPCPRVSTCQGVRLCPQWQSANFAHVSRATRIVDKTAALL